MKYIRIINNIVYEDNKVIDKTFEKYIDNLSMPYFKTLNSIRTTTKEILNIKRNIPLYISSKALLFPIIVFNTKYYINYYEVFKTSYNRNILSITFNDGETISFNLSYSKYNTLKDNINKILSYLLKLNVQ